LLKSENIAFLAINSNSTEDMEEVKKHAREHGLTFPILKDKNNVIADKFNAQVTPEIFVIDKDSRILYHGRIDDERRESDVKSADLTQV
jgi:peroxiredoxin